MIVPLKGNDAVDDVTGELFEVRAGAHGLRVAVALDSTITVIPPKIVRHQFMLRPTIKVSFELPEDITTHEAERLGKMLGTLPIP